VISPIDIEVSFDIYKSSDGDVTSIVKISISDGNRTEKDCIFTFAGGLIDPRLLEEVGDLPQLRSLT
jgi:hypothetical protein